MASLVLVWQPKLNTVFLIPTQQCTQKVGQSTSLIRYLCPIIFCDFVFSFFVHSRFLPFFLSPASFSCDPSPFSLPVVRNLWSHRYSSQGSSPNLRQRKKEKRNDGGGGDLGGTHDDNHNKRKPVMPKGALP